MWLKYYGEKINLSNIKVKVAYESPIIFIDFQMRNCCDRISQLFIFFSNFSTILWLPFCEKIFWKTINMNALSKYKTQTNNDFYQWKV